VTAAAIGRDGPPATTVDAFLGGRVAAVQPAGGHHRAGLEAVLLAAAVEPAFAGTVVDLGAGTGVAGLAVAARCPSARAILVEREPVAVACARAALALPENRGFAGRVTVAAVDIAAPVAAREAAGLAAGVADAVVMNPPFHEPRVGTPPPDPARAAAYVLAEDSLEPWLKAAVWVLRPGGRATIIFRADRLPALLAAAAGRLGALDVLPVAPRAGIPATRVVIAGVKGSRAPLRLLPPLALHVAGGNAYVPGVEALLRDGAALADVHPSWQPRAAA
jgi:tRNA1(Val) A37 N6-methylase TrmN6